MDREGLSVPETTRLLYELNQEGYDFPLSAPDAEDCASSISTKINCIGETFANTPTV